MRDDDIETFPEIPPPSPVNDRLAHVMDWVGLSAAVGMLVAAIIIAI